MVIAIEGLGWDLLSRLLEAKRLPHLEKLSSLGHRRPTYFPPPHLSISSWATVATGCHADRHGIVLPFRQIGETALYETVGFRAGAAKTIWECLDQAGIVTAVINWPATHQLCLENGYVVAPGFEVSPPPGVGVWPLNPYSYSPPNLREPILECRLASDQVQIDQIGQLLREIPVARRIPLGLQVLAALSAQSTVHNLATYVLEAYSPQAFFVKLNFLHDVMRAIDVVDCRSKSAAAIEDAAVFIDALIGRYMNIAGPSASYSIISTPTYADASIFGTCITSGDATPEPGRATEPEECTTLFYSLLRRISVEAPTTTCVGGDCPLSADLVSVLAKLHYYRNEIDAAVEVLSDALQRAPSLENAILLSDLLLEVPHERAAQTVVNALHQLPRSASISVHLVDGLKSYVTQDYQGALRAFQTMTDLPQIPINPPSWAGWSLMRMAHYQDAVTSFELAVKRDPLDCRAWEGLALSLLNVRRIGDAYGAFVRASNIAPNSRRLRTLRDFAAKEAKGAKPGEMA
ncbi:alkaline phosphatase family protein [Bradyrhizobium paxllaeri]|uniref:alkaline phosphatase family protein n=1 Tax=Bradyrhizobium paxllaeri TaxID=190148 RepID=UPI0016526F09|nr:alkaline phosphatase family protein [Bradyrhizobium paxllaeri]